MIKKCREWMNCDIIKIILLFVIFIAVLSIKFNVFPVQTGGPGVDNEEIFPGDVEIQGILQGDSPVKMLEGAQWLKSDESILFEIFVKGEGDLGVDIPDSFINTLIFHNYTASNAYNMEIAFFDHTNESPILVLNEGAAGRASLFNRSLLVGKNQAAGPFGENYTLAQGFIYADFNTPSTGADLGVEDDIEAKGSIYTQENLQVDGNATIDGDLTVNGDVNISCTKEFIILPNNGNGSALDNYYIMSLKGSEEVFFNFRVPNDFVSLTSCTVVVIPDTTETITFDLDANVAAVGEDYDSDIRSAQNQTLAVTIDDLTEVDVSTVLSSLSAGDNVGFKFGSDTDDIRVIYLLFKYA